jgi:hypothetical protein
MKPSTESGDIEIQVNFPNIREGDIPALVQATVEAMTLGNKFGQVAGIDEKTGVKQLFDLLGVEDGDVIAEDMYPDGSYETDRQAQKDAQAELDAKIASAMPQPAAPGGKQTPVKKIEAASQRLERALRLMERNGTRREAEDVEPAGHGRA